MQNMVEIYIPKLNAPQTKFCDVTQAREAGVIVQPGVEPKAKPQVRLAAPSSP
jgi:hypothetical protein